jgi:hypothetical protein
MNAVPNQRAVDQVVGVIEAGVGRDVDHQSLQSAVEADFKRFEGARIKEFVPVLVENDIRSRIVGARAH